MKASPSEASSDSITTVGTMAITRPTTPSSINMGAKARQVVRVAEATAPNTSLVPSTTAVTRSLPCSRCRWTFSTMTTASSTMMPVTSSSANVEMTFTVVPATHIAPMAPR